MPYIKSHSNYVLKSKHQDIKDGTIWERDITTIGALNQFSPGQVPIYQTSNFIISVRDDSKVTNQYNSTNWDENEHSGTVWTLNAIEGLISEDERQDDTKIVLKQDYYDLRDFAYYGSLTELFRASVTDVVKRFPGELYCTDNPIYYTHRLIESGEKVEYSERLGGDLTEVSNPFGIDIHTKSLPNDVDSIKYFANEGYKNYVMFTGDTYDENNEENYVITSCEVDYEEGCFNEETKEVVFPIGEKFATITLTNKNNDSVEISGWFGDLNSVVYLSSAENIDTHIRPLKKFIDKFYNECDNFEYLLMNPKSTPLYTTVFSVIRENEYGYYRELVTFEFPKTYGGYNIDVSEYGFNGYTNKMVEIGEYYDEYFSDNLYRSMTHEALKNFDWTYTKEYNPGEEEEYVIGGERFKKAMRIFAREFDETLSYINAIASTNIVTYDQRNNIPDYFLTDTVENEGWDIKLVIPYNLTEYYYDGDTKKIVPESGYTEGGDCKGQLGNEYEGFHITREFSQNSAAIVKPYTKELLGDMKDGWFIVCGSGDTTSCKYCNPGSGDTNYHYISTSGESRYYDQEALSGKGAIKNRIKPFTDEKEYTYLDVNNEFLRRLKLNSRAIWRHKGTIDGIEMILGMFGLKSKRWCESLYSGCCPDNSPLPDYDISEYTSFAHRIEEQWDAVAQRYRIEWLNSTKTITYDNRFISIYNRYGRNDRIYPYQGIPVAFRDEYESSPEPYIKISELTPNGTQPSTGNIDNAFKRFDENNAPVLRRYLYPSFNKYEQLDGNPYFQMDGGWNSNVVQSQNGGIYNMQYDVDDNIVFTVYNGMDTEWSSTKDNERLYKETVRNIRTFDNVASLLRMPGIEAFDGMICYVSKIETDSIVLNDVVYPIKREYYKGDQAEDGVYSYVSLIKEGNAIKVGLDTYFDTTIIVYDRNGEEVTYDVSVKPNGYEVKAYIMYDENNNPLFVCKDSEAGYFSIDSYQILDGDSDPNLTHYFKLADASYYNRLAVPTEDEEDGQNWTEGWRRLDKRDKEYLKINTIHNYYEGNNPHNGNMRYDSGHKYFTYFKRLFKHAHDNDLFDERCYEDYFDTYDNEIPYIGFSGLVEDDEYILQYDKFIYPETKIHYFGNYIRQEKTSNRSGNDGYIYKRYIYGDDTERFENFKAFYAGTEVDEENNISYNLSAASRDDGWIEQFNPYSARTEDGVVDEVTNQIMNNKRFRLTFYLYEDWYTKAGQEKLKYLDAIVGNYLTQLIPSTVIYEVLYRKDANCIPCGDISVEKECDPCAELEICSPCAELEISATCSPCDSISISANTDGGGDEPGGDEPTIVDETTVWRDVTATAGKCDTSKEVTISGTKTTRYSDGTQTSESVSTTQTYTFEKNEESLPKVLTFNYEGATITINQEAGPCTPTPPEPTVNYFTIENLDKYNNIRIFAPNADSTIILSASTDGGETWFEFETADTNVQPIVRLEPYKTLMLKGDKQNTLKRNNISTDWEYKVYGDITTLTNGYTETSGFTGLFNGNINLASAENLVLPSKTLAPYCYSNMFYRCTNITIAPELPADTLAEHCYDSMFQLCTSLTTAPELSATTLAQSCYQDMFNGCTSLTVAPELPATTLAPYCYEDMFAGCTSLTTAPELPASKMEKGCYYGMFYDCIALTEAPELSAETLAQSCYYGMFQECSSLENAPKLPATTLQAYCYDDMFRDCASLVTAPELSAETLVNYCYSKMFSGCTNIESITCLATDISATNCTKNWVNGVASTGIRTFNKAEGMCDWSIGVNGIPEGWTVSPDDCGGDEPEYDGPFTIESEEDGNHITINPCEGFATVIKLSASTDNGSTWSEITTNTDSLTQIATLGAGEKLQLKGLGSTTGNNMIRGYKKFKVYGDVTSLTNGQTNVSGFTYLFSGSTNLTSAENLKLSETLADDCYHYMFYGCRGLTHTPRLPAKTLAKNCYANMFTNCEKLTTTPVLSAKTLAEGCYWNMFCWCSGLEYASDLPATTLVRGCYQRMFYGCVNLTRAPELSAETLTNYCYQQMFYNCEKLNSIKCLATNISATYCLNDWVHGVAEDGIFTKAPSMNSWTRGEDGIPNNWRIKDA